MILLGEITSAYLDAVFGSCCWEERSETAHLNGFCVLKNAWWIKGAKWMVYKMLIDIYSAASWVKFI